MSRTRGVAAVGELFDVGPVANKAAPWQALDERPRAIAALGRVAFGKKSKKFDTTGGIIAIITVDNLFNSVLRNSCGRLD